VELRKTVAEICEELDLKEPTVYSWSKKDLWAEERDKHEILLKQLAQTVAFYSDPNVEADVMAEGNLKMLLKIQGLALARIQHAALSGLDPIALLNLPDTIQKFANALDKLNTTKIKMDNGGVEKSEVTHVHQVDMDDALRLVLSAKKEGKRISVGEAAQVLAEQQKKNKDVKPN
jgi:hypothetical protein